MEMNLSSFAEVLNNVHNGIYLMTVLIFLCSTFFMYFPLMPWLSLWKFFIFLFQFIPFCLTINFAENGLFKIVNKLNILENLVQKIDLSIFVW